VAAVLLAIIRLVVVRWHWSGWQVSNWECRNTIWASVRDFFYIFSQSSFIRRSTAQSDAIGPSAKLRCCWPVQPLFSFTKANISDFGRRNQNLANFVGVIPMT